MLQPANRLTLIEAMRPPPGYGLESAMAVSFTLDLRALLAAPAAFTMSMAAGEDRDAAGYEPIELIHALRAHAKKILVFSQMGEVALPPSRRAFAFLEGCVVPVRAPRHGVVHPKVWVLRYEAPADPSDRRLRVLIASRNLTFDASWDTLIRLDEDEGGQASLDAVGDLFESLAKTAVGGTNDTQRAHVASLTTALRGAPFALPSGVDQLHTHVLGFGPPKSPLPDRADRSLIISPFVSDDFFSSMGPSSLTELVSRVESMNGLAPATFDHIRSAYVFDDGSTPDVTTAGEDLSPLDPGRPLVGLHAKVFAFESGNVARVFLGSANATSAAFNNNVEILVELVGSVAALGIDRLCDGTKDELGLRSLFSTYSPADASGAEDVDSSLDGLRRRLAAVEIRGVVEESGPGWATTYRSAEPLPMIEGIEISCWPLASPGSRRDVEAGTPLDVRFETSLESISGFLGVELADATGSVSQFVLPVPLDGVPEHRERALLRALIGNADRFLRYLLALLDEDPTEMELLDAIESTSEDADASARPVNLPVLEKLLRARRRDPARLDALHPLVSDLAADNALPPGFAELWTTIYGVKLSAGDAR